MRSVLPGPVLLLGRGNRIKVLKAGEEIELVAKAMEMGLIRSGGIRAAADYVQAAIMTIYMFLKRYHRRKGT